MGGASAASREMLPQTRSPGNGGQGAVIGQEASVCGVEQRTGAGRGQGVKLYPCPWLS